MNLNLNKLQKIAKLIGNSPATRYILLRDQAFSKVQFWFFFFCRSAEGVHTGFRKAALIWGRKLDKYENAYPLTQYD